MHVFSSSCGHSAITITSAGSITAHACTEASTWTLTVQTGKSKFRQARGTVAPLGRSERPVSPLECSRATQTPADPSEETVPPSCAQGASTSWHHPRGQPLLPFVPKAAALRTRAAALPVSTSRRRPREQPPLRFLLSELKGVRYHLNVHSSHKQVHTMRSVFIHVALHTSATLGRRIRLLPRRSSVAMRGGGGARCLPTVLAPRGQPLGKQVVRWVGGRAAANKGDCFDQLDNHPTEHEVVETVEGPRDDAPQRPTDHPTFAPPSPHRCDDAPECGSKVLCARLHTRSLDTRL